MKGKWLAIGIILLFLGIAVTPTINSQVVKASKDNDFVEVTTQADGIEGYGKTMVKLTKEQYQDLEQYLTQFRAKLNQTSMRMEAVPLFKETVTELHKYGLLPKGMSIDQAQKLMLQQNQHEHLTILQERFLPNRILLNSDGNNFSLIAGHTTNTLILGPIPLLCLVPGYIGLILLASASTSLQGVIGASLFYSSLLVGLLFYFLPGVLVSVIRVGAQEIHIGDPEAPTEYIPSEGWISSFSVTDKKTWTGPFYGNMVGPGLIGVIGFTGLKIALLNDCIYLGSAMKIDLSTNPPSSLKEGETNG